MVGRRTRQPTRRGPEAAGRRDAVTARRFRAALPKRCRRHGWYVTDLFPAYA
ncbi:hypothetical protein [Hymenobacter sp. BT190]|uniref:hypothetical protein n=1 Tax=Hymenobacter sp. BT190 TaxID=2763505 RepID=UPI0021C8795F|nr:hypothetical protein [Hymenobacter sp. BT190]